MNPSLSRFPAVAAGSGTTPGKTQNLSSNHAHARQSGDFGGVMGKAYSAQSPAKEGPAQAQQDGKDRSVQAQELPQAGKLLPLLRQTLDSVADSGMDLKQFVEDLVDKLKAAGSGMDAQPADQLALALQQLVQDQPALKSVLPADILAAAARGSSLDRNAALQGLLASGADAANGQQATNAGKPFSLDSVLSQLQQSVAGEQPRDMTVLAAALKRLAGDGRSTFQDALTRSESPVAGAAAPGNASATTQAGTGLPSVAVNTPFGQAGWDEALGERIQWLANQKVQGAQVKLNPANLGPMEVRIHVQNDQASVQFAAQHAVVREALEAALPRLRDMFEAAGVHLVDVDVSDGQSFAERHQASHDASPSSGSRNFDADEAVPETHRETSLADFLEQGRLDLFA